MQIACQKLLFALKYSPFPALHVHIFITCVLYFLYNNTKFLPKGFRFRQKFSCMLSEVRIKYIRK
jgi:hypothetical protein